MPIPEWLEPMAATLTQERFAGPDWIFERKFDGIRLLAYKQGDAVCLYSRNRLPQTMPAVADAIRALPAEDIILDGEVTWDGSSGYHVFDILWMNGRRVTALPIEERRALLASLPFRGPMRRVDRIEDPAPWDLARREGWEGVIAKRRGSPYEHRRSKHWLKMKVETAQEFVIGGFTDPRGARVGLGALLIGYYAAPQGSPGPAPLPKHADADFVFAGKVGTGLDTKGLLELRHRLDALAVEKPPFTKGKGLPRHGRWVRPEVVVQVGFIEWTPHGKLRHPRLLAIRADKNPRDVVREPS
jgi:ATP-dependent DNA ligase